MMEVAKVHTSRVVTVPRPHDRPAYTTIVSPLEVTVEQEEKTDCIDLTLRIKFADWQWAEYLEMPLSDFVNLRRTSDE